MDSTEPVIETAIFHLKEGVNLDNVISEASTNSAAEAFIQLANILKAQEGYMGQYWGPHVKLPHLFVWIIEWKSFQLQETFSKCEDYKQFAAGLGQLFDVQKEPPILLFSPWSAEADKAFKSSVTEVAFFELPNGATKEAKDTLGELTSPVGHYVVTVGKATGSYSDWVFKIAQKGMDIPIPGGEYLWGVFGYASIDDHMKWRETPEIQLVIKAFQAAQERGVSIQAAKVPGVDSETGWFHVKFQSGL